ncbi:hypothetical protein Dpoa2040_000600, partial [Dickeya sp. CFBP 2040]|uniref:hypothetical protein n=1 Tax=Dickeya sp. CFBP 2040 TaxID=2718531 RepID=UPI0014471AD5
MKFIKLCTALIASAFTLACPFYSTAQASDDTNNISADQSTTLPHAGKDGLKGSGENGGSGGKGGAPGAGINGGNGG